MALPDRHIHKLDPEQFDVISNGIALLIAELRFRNGPRTPDPQPAPLDLWTFHDPHLKREVGAWVDERNQVRHIPLTDADKVPAHWRRIRLDPPQGPRR